MECWRTVFPRVFLGIPRGAPGMARGAQGFPREVPRGAQGMESPESWDSQRLGIPWLPLWASWLGMMEGPLGY